MQKEKFSNENRNEPNAFNGYCIEYLTPSPKILDTIHSSEKIWKVVLQKIK